MLQRIRSTGDSHELLDMMSQAKRKDVEPRQLSQAFSRLFSLQRNGYNSVHPSQLIRHSGFENMCNILKYKAQRMEVNDLFECLKVLTFFGVQSDSLTTQRVLDLIRDQINDLSLNHLVFLSFLINKMHKTPLTEALKIAIPIVFNLNISLKLDHNNTTELCELMHFISISPIKLSVKSMTSIITALTLHGNNLTPEEARSIVWSIASMRRFDKSLERLFENCLRIVNENIMDMTFSEVETTLAKLVEKFQEGEYIFCNEDFFNKAAKYVIEKDVGYLNASYILKKFNKLSFVNYDLLKYMNDQIVNNHSNLSSCRSSGLLTFSCGFSNAKYKSDSWDIIKSVLHENPLLHSGKDELPWIRFALELLSLDFHSNILFEKVFDSKFLDNFLKRSDNKLDMVQLLTLWQAVKLLIPDYDGPLPEQRFIDDAMIVNFARPVNEGFHQTLADIFGGRQFIQTNVASSYGHCLDFVISFDNHGNPITMPCRIKAFDDLPKSQVTSVAIFLHGRTCFPLNYPGRMRGIFDLRRRTIEQLDIKTVSISAPIWNNLPESEVLSFLEREIRYCLGT